MALKMNYVKNICYYNNSSIQGVSEVIEQEQIFPDVYLKIGNMQGAKTIIFDLEVFRDESKENLLFRDNKADFRFELDITKPENHIKQAYDYLKTLPEFQGAEDC